MFSGAKTEKDAPLSEADSYRNVLVQCFGKSDIVQQAMADGRIVCEDAATDSYQNLLFSLIKYYEIKREWPQMVTVVTHGFKEARFLVRGVWISLVGKNNADRYLQECHAEAICWPSEKIRVQGISPPFPLSELRDVQRLEKDTLELFRKDPHGMGAPLSTKRAARQWVSGVDILRNIENTSVRGSLQRLLDCRGRNTFPKPLPWTKSDI